MIGEGAEPIENEYENEYEYEYEYEYDKSGLASFSILSFAFLSSVSFSRTQQAHGECRELRVSAPRSRRPRRLPAFV